MTITVGGLTDTIIEGSESWNIYLATLCISIYKC